MKPINKKKQAIKETNNKHYSKKRVKLPVIPKSMLAFILFIIIAFIGIFSGTIYGYLNTIEHLNIDNLKLNFSSIVYYIGPDKNEPIEFERLYAEENRVWVDIKDIPKNLQDAFIAIEDQRFEKHAGFDLKRTFGAALNYIIKSNSSYGGSTITQQLVKNLTGDKDVSPKRKIQEIWRAISLEKHLSKKQILEYYLNTIYLSQGCNGVQAAANTYFGKDVSALTLAECASIAGITQYPTHYDPLLNPENNKKKQELVLRKMLDLGYISREEFDNANKEELVFKKGSKKDTISKQSYFVDQLINDVLSDLVSEKGYSLQVATKLLYTGGLKIYSTVDPNVQLSMDKFFKDDKFFKGSNFPSFNTSKQPEAAMLIMDQFTGEVKGVAGGKGAKTASRTLNRATQTVRQPGSSIKPIAVYAPAIEYGYITPGTVVDDVPSTFNSGTSNEWSPRNWYSDYWGLSNIRRGIEWSMNIVAVKVLNQLGVDRSFNFMKKNLNITSLVDREKRSGGIFSDKQLNSLALGGLTDGISVVEMTASYVPFVNKGIYIKPHTYSKVLDNDGKTLLKKSKESHIAMSEQTAFLMTKMLEGVVTSGTGTIARLGKGIPSAGKTGSTSDNKDKWYVGYSPYYTAAVWYGFDEPREMDSELSGKPNPAAVIWGAVMNEVHKNLSAKSFPMPQGIVSVEICRDSGMKPNDYCSLDLRGSRVYTEYFKRGTEPSEECNVHVIESVDTSNNLLSNKYCPEDLVKERIFILRPTPYSPVFNSWGGPILPKDAIYELPAGEYCNEHGPAE